MENKINMKDLDLKCRICSENYYLPDKKPILLPCLHTVCNSCLKKYVSLFSNDYQCQICEKDFNIEKTSDNSNLIRKINARIFKKLRCPNNHKTEFTIKNDYKYFEYIYTETSRLHNKLYNYVPFTLTCVNDTVNCVNIGYFCKECCFLICLKCSNTIPPLDECIIGHELIWTRIKGRCINENTDDPKNNGFVCKEGCLYYICYCCRKMKVNSKECFNNHSLTWMRKENTCVKCNLYQKSGFYCKEDDFFACDKCLKTNYLKFE